MAWDYLVAGSTVGVVEFAVRGAASDGITGFMYNVVARRRDFRVWRNLVLEDPPVHPYKWLRPDLVFPALFLTCDSEVTVDGSCVLVELSAIYEQFRKARLPFFCRRDRGSADLDSFSAAAEELTPLLDEVKLPPLSGEKLYDAVQKKRPAAGSLDGWNGERSMLFMFFVTPSIVHSRCVIR